MRRIGVIAEDKSDVDVLDEIIRKYKVSSFKIVDAIGNGCGRIHAKCNRWSINLRDRGCTRLILLHDSDRKSPATLRASLLAALRPNGGMECVIVVPVQEIEAWLLSDEVAIKRAMKLKANIKRIPNPEAVNDPKERLAREIFRNSNRRVTYLNTRHNKQIAHEISLNKLRRCISFEPLDRFIVQHLQ